MIVKAMEEISDILKNKDLIEDRDEIKEILKEENEDLREKGIEIVLPNPYPYIRRIHPDRDKHLQKGIDLAKKHSTRSD